MSPGMDGVGGNLNVRAIGSSAPANDLEALAAALAVMDELIDFLETRQSSAQEPGNQEPAGRERQRRDSDPGLQSGTGDGDGKRMSPVSPPSGAYMLGTPDTVARVSLTPKPVYSQASRRRELFPQSSPANSPVVVVGGFEPAGVPQKLISDFGGEGSVAANSLLSSPLRTISAENIEGLGELRDSIKAALDAAFSHEVSTPEAIAKAMKGVYRIHKNDLDVFVEAFGEVLAEKGAMYPVAFHAFFQTIPGIEPGTFTGKLAMSAVNVAKAVNLKASIHIETMQSRFVNGFVHRLDKIKEESPGTVPNVATAPKEILRATIAGVKSCIQNMGKTLEVLGQGKMPQNEALIRDIAEILMSETNRGGISDPNSGISTLCHAVIASPKLGSALAGTQTRATIAGVLETEYETKNVALGSAVPVASLSAPTHAFHTTVTMARVLDILTPIKGAMNLEAIATRERQEAEAAEATQSAQSRNPAPPPSTREAALYLKITFPDMHVGVSNVQTRAALDGYEMDYNTIQQSTMAEAVGTIQKHQGEGVARASSVPASADARHVSNLQFSFLLHMRKANLASETFDAARAARLKELQDDFTTKLTAGIVLPATADSVAWQPAANSLRELNTAFVDLYRYTDAGTEYQTKKGQLEALASRLMAAYTEQEVAQIIVPGRTFGVSLDDQLKALDAVITDSRDSTPFSALFGGDAAPFTETFTAGLKNRNAAIEDKLMVEHGVLPTKRAVATEKLTAATEAVKTALAALYIVLGKVNRGPAAETEAGRRKNAAIAHQESTRTAAQLADVSLCADDLSMAANTLNGQATDISERNRACTAAQNKATLGLDPANVTESALLQRYTEAIDDVAGPVSLSPENAKENSDASKTTAVLSELGSDVRTAVLVALRAFVKSGIKPKSDNEPNTHRLTYLKEQSARLGENLPSATLTELKSLSGLEGFRISNEKAAAVLRDANIAKQAALDSVSVSKAALGPLRESRDEFRSRRLDDAPNLAETTDSLATELQDLSPLTMASADSDIEAYKGKIDACSVAMGAEMRELQVKEREDLDSIASLQTEHDGVVEEYTGKIARLHTPSEDVTRLSGELRAQGDKPYASTMKDLAAAIKADTSAMVSSLGRHQEQLSTANSQFATATADLKTTLSAFYKAIGADDTAVDVATAKATVAKTSAKVDGDPRIDVQTTRTDAARGRLTGETGQIRALTENYGAAQKAIDAAVRAAWATTGLKPKLETVLAEFNRKASGMPGAEKDAALQSLQATIATQLIASAEAAKAIASLLAADAPPQPKEVAQQKPVDPNIAIRHAQAATLNGAITDLSRSLNASAQAGSLDAFQAALTTGLKTLRDAADAAPLGSTESKAKKALTVLKESIEKTLQLSQSIVDGRVATTKFPGLKAMQQHGRRMNDIPEAWRGPLVTELKMHKKALDARTVGLEKATTTLDGLVTTLAQALKFGDATTATAIAAAAKALADAKTLGQGEDELDGATRAIGTMKAAIATAVEAKEAASMARAAARLAVVEVAIREEFDGEDVDGQVQAELANAEQKARAEASANSTPSTIAHAKATILEARLTAITEAKKAAALAAAQELMDIARQGVSDATARLGVRLSEWERVAGLAVPTAEMIVTDMVKTLFPGLSEKSLSPAELDTLRDDIAARSAAYEGITKAAAAYNHALGKGPGNVFIQSAAIYALYGQPHIPKRENENLIATEKLVLASTALKTMTAHALSVQATQDAEETREKEISKLGQTRAKLTELLKQAPVEMAARATLLKTAYDQLDAIDTETQRLFPEATQPGASHANNELASLTKKVKAKYSDYLAIDKGRILRNSHESLRDIGTASSANIDTVSTRIQTAHSRDTEVFKTAYTIKKEANASERDAAVSELSVFARQLSGAVAGRRGQIEKIRQAYVAANNQLAAAFGDATQGIDFKKTTASELNVKTSAFTAACNDARAAMVAQLRDISQDPNQLVLVQVSEKIASDQTQLKEHFTSNASGSITGSSDRLSDLTDTLSEETSIEELNAHTDSALELQARAADLEAFLNPGILDGVKRVVNAYLANVISVAENAAAAAIREAKQSAIDGVDVATVTPVQLEARIDTLNARLEDAVQKFNEKTLNIPESMTRTKQGEFRELLEAIPLEIESTLKTAVSEPLQTARQEIQALLTRDGVTLADLNAAADRVNTLSARQTELGDEWLTAGLGDEIRGTIEAYDSRLDAMRTRAGQIQTLTGALGRLTFEVPVNATFQEKWGMIKKDSDSRDTLRDGNQGIIAEPTITQALADLAARRTAAIENRVPEQRALIAGLVGQLDTLAAGFGWDKVLTGIETSAMDTFPVADRAEMQDAFTTPKGEIAGLQDAVRTRVTAREALTTATNSLDRWPALGNLADIQKEITAAKKALASPQIVEFDVWDAKISNDIAALQGQFDAAVQLRDALIVQFQAITNMPVRTDTLANRWTDIAAKETEFSELQALPANAEMRADPQVAETILAVQDALDLHNAPMDLGLERAAFRVGMNAALADTALTTVDAVLDSAAVQMQDGLSVAILGINSFKKAVAAVKVENQKYQGAIAARIIYRNTIVAAQGFLDRVQGRAATGADLEAAIGTIGDVPAIVDPGDGTNIFETADAAMATQRQNIADGLAEHTALVAAFTAAIAAATSPLPDMTATPLITAQAKWKALNLANDKYNGAVTAGDYLFGNVGVQVHPDIKSQDYVFKMEFYAQENNVTPEATEIRHAAAASLAAFVAPGSIASAPVFATLRNGLLDGLGIPVDARGAVETALAGSGIQAEIQSRVALHNELEQLAADNTSTPGEKKTAIDAAKVLLTKLPANAAYAACDKILADRLQVLQIKIYGAAAEEEAQAQLSTKISHVAEATKTGTTSSLIEMGAMWQSLETKFRDPNVGPGWKYNVSLDDAFTGILDGTTPPKDTTEYVSFLRTAINRLNLQANPPGLPDPYKDIAEKALVRLEGRNDSPRLCAWAMSANLRLVMSVIETFGDTRAAKVSGRGVGNDNDIALHEGITLKQPAVTLTGYSIEHGALWSTLHSGQIEFLQIADLDKNPIPGSMLSAENIAALIKKMGTGQTSRSIEGYVPANGGSEATLTQAGWKSFCTVLGAEGHAVAFLEARWPVVSDDPIPLRELHSRLEELLKDEAEYKHLRYLFGRKLERVYQDLVIENVSNT